MRLLLTFLFLILLSCVMTAIVINDLAFTGLETVQSSELIALVNDYLNVELTDQGVQELLRKVFDTGYFSTLEPKMISSGKGYILQINVQENPVVRGWRIDLVGPELIKKTDLESVVKLEKNKALSITKIRDSLQAIKEKFDEAGYFLIEVSGDLDKDIYVFKIIQYALWEVYFEGETDGLDFSKIRKEIKIDTLKDFYTTPGFLRILTKDIKRCYPTVENMSSVMSVLNKYVYFDKDTSINFEKMEVPGVDEKTAVLKINVVLKKIISDAKLYKKIEIIGNQLIPTTELKNSLTVKPNQAVYNVDILKSMQSIVDYYESKGYPMVYVLARDKDEELFFEVLEKYVSQVELKGLEITKEYVISDLITFEKGNPLQKQDFYDTISALNRTQFFESVSAYPVGTIDSTEVKVIIDISEKKRKFDFSGGITWAPPKGPWYEGFMGEVTLATINPFGYGQSFSVTGKLGLETKSISFDYSVRKPFALPATLGALLSYEYVTSDSSITNIFKIGGNFTTLRSQGHAFGVGATYEYRYYSNLADDENTLILSGNYSYDTRNSAIFATNGQYLYLGLDKAGLFGILDDRDYWKARLDARIFLPVYEDLLSFALRGFAATLFLENYKVPGTNQEKILFHGLNAVRGVESGEAKAGWLGSFELRYDLKSQTVPMYLLAFVDIGGTGSNLWQTGFSFTAGPELDIAVPMLGVIGFGVAYNFDGKWTFENFKPFFRFGGAF
ncbi:MAG: outer membrane protein assembly factor [Pseudothermotoga sp.]